MQFSTIFVGLFTVATAAAVAIPDASLQRRDDEAEPCKDVTARLNECFEGCGDFETNKACNIRW